MKFHFLFSTKTFKPAMLSCLISAEGLCSFGVYILISFHLNLFAAPNEQMVVEMYTYLVFCDSEFCHSKVIHSNIFNDPIMHLCLQQSKLKQTFNMYLKKFGLYIYP